MKHPERSRRFFLLFIIAFFVIMAVSGGTQLFLSPQRVASWIKPNLPNYEHLDIEFKKAQISFSGSLFPLFGIKAKDVLIRYHGCTSSLQLNAPYILVPFSLTDAVRKKLRFGYLKAGDVDLQILKKDNVCLDQVGESGILNDPDEVGAPAQKVTEALENQDFDKLFKTLLRPFRGASGLKIQKLKVYRPSTVLLENPHLAIDQAKDKVVELESQKKPPVAELATAKEELTALRHTKRVEIQRLRLTYDKSNEAILFSGGVKIRSPLFDSIKRLPVYWLSIEMNKEKGLKIAAQSRYNEGRFYLDSDYQKNLEKLRVKWKATDFPVSLLVKALDTRHVFSQLNTHLLWLNGEGALGLSYNKELQVGVMANLLRVRGELVDALAQDVALSLYPEVKVLDPFEWRIEKLDLEQISEFLDHKGLRGVLRRAGSIRGSGIMNGFKDVIFEGSVEGVEFFFSNSGQKAFQKVQKAEMNVEYFEDRLKIDLERIVFGEGEVEGQIGFELTTSHADHKGYQWQFKSSGQSLKFNEQVYALFMLQPFSFDSFNILVQGQENHAHKFAVSAAIEQCGTQWGAFEGVSLNINAQNSKTLNLQMKSKKFTVNSKYVQFGGLVPNELGNASVDMQLDLDTDIGSIDFVALEPKVGPLKITAKDVAYKTKAFDGQLTRAGQTYQVHGDLASGYKFKLAE